MNKLDEKKKKRLRIAFALVLLIIITIFISNSKSELLEDNAEVKPRSELTYYLNVTYDGIDRNGVQSSDTKMSKVSSGTIYVEDRIPDGLEFLGFVTTTNGTIGAVKRDDESMCAGHVVDDTHEASNDTGVWNDTNTEYTYHGLHYNAETRMVTFTVKYLQAGCKLMVGIKTKTPPLDDPDTPVVETRRDFYNFATARERTLNKKSNTVHVFMGKENIVLQNVSYQYTGTVPENAPELPETTSYAPGASVGVAPSAKMEGYSFSGWTTENATINNNSFYMPNTDVILKGSFTRLPDHKVDYSISGDIPDDYSLPKEERYYPETVVKLDTLKEGDIINGYRFLGWTSNDVEISEDRDFIMPEQDVTLEGSFEEEKYQLSYEFGGTQPPNSDSLLPQVKSIKPGTKVTLDSVSSEPNGYKFLGWLNDDEFEMPNDNVVILGEWKANSNNINLIISVDRVYGDLFNAYKDKVKDNVTIKNVNTYRVSNIMLKESLDGEMITSGLEKVEILSNHIANISYLEPNESITIPIEYTIKKNDIYDLTNTVEIIGASAEDGHELPETNYSKNYTIGVKKPVKICVNVNNFDTGNIFQIKIYRENTYLSRHYTTMKSGDCKTFYLDQSTDWKIEEILPQEYKIHSIRTSDNEHNDIKNGIKINVNPEDGPKTITFENSFVNKVFVHASGHAINEAPYEAGG